MVLACRRGLPLPMIKGIMPELLQLETTEAFRPEMWDRALAPRLTRRRRLPSARLLDVAIEACNRLGAPLVVIGDGPDRGRLEALAGPTVRLLGRLERSKPAESATVTIDSTIPA